MLPERSRASSIDRVTYLLPQPLAVSPNGISFNSALDFQLAQAQRPRRNLVLLSIPPLVILDNAQLENSVQDCPSQDAPPTIKYSLIVYNHLGQIETLEAIFQVVCLAPPTEPLLAPPTEPLPVLMTVGKALGLGAWVGIY